MLRLALAAKPPTGFMHDIVVEDTGERKGTFDIKHGGLLPGRGPGPLRRASGRRAGRPPRSSACGRRQARGCWAPTEARILEEAFDLFSALRLEHQVDQLERGQRPDDHLDPSQLDPLTRRYLRDAFREVSAVQRKLTGELSRALADGRPSQPQTRAYREAPLPASSTPWREATFTVVDLETDRARSGRGRDHLLRHRHGQRRASAARRRSSTSWCGRAGCPIPTRSASTACARPTSPTRRRSTR